MESTAFLQRSQAGCSGRHAASAFHSTARAHLNLHFERQHYGRSKHTSQQPLAQRPGLHSSSVRPIMCTWQRLATSRPPQRAMWRNRNVLRHSATGAAVPMPLGDDQGSLIYTALSEVEDEHDRAVAAAAAAAAAAASSNGAVNGGPQGSPGGSNKQFIAHRWRIVFMMALAFVLCNMDKVNMSVAVIPMAEELGWTATQRGLVSSSFFWGYASSQITAGWASTKIGGTKVLLVGVLLWSLGTLVAPPAAHMGLWYLCASRAFVGLGEGLAPSSATNVMARQVPEGERARAVTTVFGGLDVGSAVGLILCGPMIRMFGWPSVFYLFAAIGIVWSALWPLLKPAMPDPDVQHAPDHHSSLDSTTEVPWGTFLRSKPVWAIIVAHFCFNWGYYTLLAWLPSYFQLSLGLNVESSSLLTLIPYIAMTAMTPLVGPIADGLVSKGWTITRVRKFAQGIAFAGPALCMLGCALLTPSGARHTTAAAGGSFATVCIVSLLSVSFALGAWSRAGLYCNHQDLSPKYAGALLGLTNTAGAFPGVLGVSAVGLLLDRTNSWGAALFYPMAACQIFGLIIYSSFASSKRQDWA